MITFAVDSKEFRGELLGITQRLYSGEIQRIFLAGARVVATAARRNAPKRTGLLRKAIMASGVRKSTVATRGPSAVAIVNLKKGKRVRAPHGHLVEGGTNKMEGRFFFARAVTESGQRVLDKATSETVKIIEKGLGR